MNFLWQKVQQWMHFLRTIEPDTAEVRTRIRYMERDIGLPVRAIVISLLFYYLFLSNWFEDVKLGGGNGH